MRICARNLRDRARRFLMQRIPSTRSAPRTDQHAIDRRAERHLWPRRTMQFLGTALLSNVKKRGRTLTIIGRKLSMHDKRYAMKGALVIAITAIR